MTEQTNAPAAETAELPPVFVEVPDTSGLLNAGTTTALNTGLTAAEVLTAAEPAPVQYGTKAQRRRRDILGITWILACGSIGVLYGVFERAWEGPNPGEAEWALWALTFLIPVTFVFTFYPHWQDRRHKKRHKEWLSRFILLWPLRERLVEVERIRDLRQRIIVEDMAAAMAEGREALHRESGAPSHADSVLLMQALAAVGAYAKAASDEPALEAEARHAVAQFSEKAGRRRELPAPSGPPSALPGRADQRLRRRSNGSVNDGGR